MSLGSASNFFLGAASATGGGGFELLKSVRFNSADSAHLSRTPSSAGNLKKWTWAGWVKRSGTAGQQLFSAGTGTEERAFIRFLGGSDTLCFEQKQSSTWNTILRSSAVFRDFSAWYHIVVAYDSAQSTAANRVKMYVNGAEITEFGSSTYPPQNQDGKINTTTIHAVGTTSYSTSTTPFSGCMADVYFIDGSALDPTSFGEFDDNGVWQAKDASDLTFGTNGFHLFDFANESGIGDDSSGNDNDWTVNNLTGSSTAGTVGVTTTVPQDLTGDWLGVLGVTATNTNGAVAVFPDGGGATQPDKGKFYWSGLTVGDTITVYCTGSGQNRTVTGDVEEASSPGYVPVPGASLGNFTVTVTAASGSCKVDHNGTSNCYGITPGPLSSRYFDDAFDVPTNGTQSDTGAGGEVSGNYPTWNPLDKNTNITLSNGNLDAAETSGANHFAGRATFKYPATGKWYYEATVKTLGGACCVGVDNSGLANPSLSNSGVYLILVNSSNNVQRYIGSSYTSFDSAYGNPTVGSVLQVAYDADADKLWLGMNNVWMGSGSSANGNPGAGSEATASNVSDPFPSVNLVTSALSVNFGQRPFTYSAPSGFKALCTTNLPTPTIADGSDHFDIKLYTGTGTTNAITGFDFSPDWVWTKQRGESASHALYDNVRGAGELIRSNETTAEVNVPSRFISFDTNGYTIGSDSTENNASGKSFVAWCWDAGSSTVSNTDGTITSQVRANTSAGFSICTYTGSSSNFTFGHGLNAEPKLILIKNRSSTANWFALTEATGSWNYAYLNLNSAFSGAAQEANSTVVDLKNAAYNWYNANGDNFVAYCFAPVAGYSAIGSYTGNASTDGPFRYTGFRPAFLLIKIFSGNTSNWLLLDSARDTYNIVENNLYADENSAENQFDWVDFLSNGFKVRNGTLTQINGSGYTYIYAAFAENPFQANGGLAR